MEIEMLIKMIVQCAYNVRQHLAAGFLESVYQKALLLELEENGIEAESEVSPDFVNVSPKIHP